MEVFSRFDTVKRDTGEPVSVGVAIYEASEAVSLWREEQLAARGLDGVEAEGKFVLLCWDVLGAEEFRFNEASLLGRAVGIDIDQLIAAGLVAKSGEKIRMLTAKERRRDRPLELDDIEETLFGPVTVPKKRRKADVFRVHPNDPKFRTTLDACHALALRYLEAGGGGGGVGSAKALVRAQHFSKDSAVAKLMEALVKAAPEAFRFDRGKKSAAARFPEFRAWHALLEPLFGIAPVEWVEAAAPQPDLPNLEEEEDEDEETEGESE